MSRKEAANKRRQSRSWAALLMKCAGVVCFCAAIALPAARADTLALPTGGFGAFEFEPVTSSTGEIAVGAIIEASATAPPGGWEWGWDIGTTTSVPGELLSYPAGGGFITQPSGLQSFFELTGAIQGVGDQVFLAGFITWEFVEPVVATQAEIVGSVDFSTIEGGSPESPISISNLSDFGALHFVVSCAPDNCLSEDPMGTIESLTLTYSYTNSGTSAVPEPATWWIIAAGLSAIAFRRGWLRRTREAAG